MADVQTNGFCKIKTLTNQNYQTPKRTKIAQTPQVSAGTHPLEEVGRASGALALAINLITVAGAAYEML